MSKVMIYFFDLYSTTEFPTCSKKQRLQLEDLVIFILRIQEHKRKQDTRRLPGINGTVSHHAFHHKESDHCWTLIDANQLLSRDSVSSLASQHFTARIILEICRDQAEMLSKEKRKDIIIKTDQNPGYSNQPVAQSCAVAKSEQFWRATGQSNLT